MTADGGEPPMEASVETRLQYLEDRVKTLESLLGVGTPVRKPEPAAPAPAAIWPPPPSQLPPRPAPRPREPLDLEELLGGRVLGWVGGAAVVLAAVFFLVMAVHNGWIDEATRGVLALARPAPLRARRGLAFRPKGRAPGPPRARPPRHRTL